jgi:uncharacterized OB-fold protein
MISAGTFRVLPEIDEENRFFWTSGADGRLRFLRCGDCGQYVHPPVPTCPICAGRHLAPEVVSGRGEVFSFTINHQPWDGDPLPYVIALVALDEQEGLRLTTNIVDTDIEQVRIGLPVTVRFEQHDDVFLPMFAGVDR